METITTIERVSSGNAYKTQRKDETNKNMLEIIIKICNGILCLLLPLFSVYEMIKHPHKPYAICIRKPYVHLRSGVERKKNGLFYFKWKSTMYNALIWRKAVNKCVPFEIRIRADIQDPKHSILWQKLYALLSVRLLPLFHQPNNNYLWMHRHVRNHNSNSFNCLLLYEFVVFFSFLASSIVYVSMRFYSCIL